MLADDVVYELPGRHLGGGVLRGKTALLGRIAAAARWYDAPPKIVLLEVVSAGALVVSLERFVAERRGVRVDQHAAVVWRFSPEGRCVAMSTRFEDKEAVDRFWKPFTPDRRGALRPARGRGASPRARR